MSPLDSLPVWPEAVQGEAPSSWLARARLACGLNTRLWALLVRMGSTEPERGTFIDGRPWAGFPPQVASISDVPAMWRVAPALRSMHCSQCSSCQEEHRRLPQLVKFFDARRFTCPRHSVWLSYGSVGPGSVIATEHSFHSWLESWIDTRIESVDSAFRRDLAVLFSRNWKPMVGPSESTEFALEASAHLPSLPQYRTRWPAMGPARFGDLSPHDRLMATYLAYECWNSTVFDGRALPMSVSKKAKEWLSRRWPAGRIEHLRRELLK